MMIKGGGEVRYWVYCLLLLVQHCTAPCDFYWPFFGRMIVGLIQFFRQNKQQQQPIISLP